MSCEEEAAFCVLTSCCLIPLSLFQLKELWTDVLPVVGIGWGGGARKLKLICQLVSKNRIAILIGHAVCVCVLQSLCLSLCRVCLSHSWTVFLCTLSLPLSLCLTHRPCHEFSLTPWGHSHMKL